VLIAEKTNWSANAKESSLRLANDIKSGYNSKVGMECHDFHPSASIASTEQESTRTGAVDVGLLRCDSNSSCIRDPTSSTGGRCFASSTFRSLQICDKCIGDSACYGLIQSFIDNNIGCGSCIGNDACKGLNREFRCL
jgi:hypothetical protein